MTSSWPRSSGAEPELAAHRSSAREPPAIADAALVEGARAGDRAAFRRLYERHAPMVHAVLLARVPPSDADDLMQQVFFATWRGLARLRNAEQAGAWIAGIARNLARRHRARRAPPAEVLAESFPAPQGEHDRHDNEEESATILAALRALPEAYRETLVLRLVEGMSGPQIAEARGLTHGSVRVNLTRGMKLLRERLAREGLV